MWLTRPMLAGHRWFSAERQAVLFGSISPSRGRALSCTAALVVNSRRIGSGRRWTETCDL